MWTIKNRPFKNTVPDSGCPRFAQIAFRVACTTGRIPTARDLPELVLAPSGVPVCSMSRMFRFQTTHRRSSRSASCVRNPVSHSTSITGAPQRL